MTQYSHVLTSFGTILASDTATSSFDFALLIHVNNRPFNIPIHVATKPSLSVEVLTFEGAQFVATNVPYLIDARPDAARASVRSDCLPSARTFETATEHGDVYLAQVMRELQTLCSRHCPLCETNRALSTNVSAPNEINLPSSSDTQFRTSDEAEDLAMCVVCLEKTKTHAFVPCGHMCCCEGCASTLTSCCVCRHPITTTLKIYS